LAVVMAGCGGSYLQWAKPGASLQQAKQDGVECRQISRQPYDEPVGGVIVRGSDPDVRIWKECLEARGYTVTEQSDSPGSHCVASNATVGTRVKSQNGKMLKVATLYGDSPRCANPATPILADLEEDK
jgi:hypothetical protein